MELSRRLAFIWPFVPALLAPIGTMDAARGAFALDAYLINALCIVIATPLLVGVHETAHATAGILLGGRVERVQVGSGRKLAAFGVAGVTVQLCATPAGGTTWISPPASGRLLGVREWLWTLAGPLSDAMVVAFAGLIARPDSPPLWVLGTGLSARVDPLQVLALVAALHLVYQLLYLTADGDLARLLTIPLRRTRHTSIHAAEVEQLYAEGRHDEALARARSVLEERDDTAVRLWASHIHLARAEFMDAREVLAPAFAKRGHLSLAMRRDVEAAWAWTLVYCDDRDAVREAVSVSAALHAEYPSWPWFDGIHGAALVAAGRIDEGVSLLREAFDENIEDDVRAHDAAWLAIAETRRGRLDEAASWQARAESLDEQCYSLVYLRKQRDTEDG